MSSSKKLVIGILAIALFGSVLSFGLTYTDKAAAAEADSVILAEVPFGEITAPMGTEWGRGDLETRAISPLASSGRSIEFYNNSAAWFNLDRTLGEGINAEEALGISYDAAAKTSDLGVAFWMYIGNEATLSALRNGTTDIYFRLGNDPSNTWYQSKTLKQFGLDEKINIGWNEFVLLHDVGWVPAGAPTIDNLAYMALCIENMAASDKILAINNIRLVKTSQTDALVLNRYEAPSFDYEDAVTVMEASEEGISKYWPTGATLSENVPEGMSGYSVKLPAMATGNDRVFSEPVDASAAGKDWLKLDEITGWQSAAAVAFWMYIPDAVSFKDAMANASGEKTAYIQISDKDGGSVSVDLKAGYKYFNNGWNRVIIHLYNGMLNVTGINYFGMSNTMNVAQEFEFYGVCVARANVMQKNAEYVVINDNTTGEPFPNSSNEKVVTFDTAEGWTNAAEAAVILGKNAVVAQEGKNLEYAQALALEGGWTSQFVQMTYWLYTDAPSVLRSSMTSVIVAESREAYEAGNYYSFSTADIKLVRGWNQIRLRLSEDNIYEGTVDNLSVGYFKFNYPSSDTVKIAISDFRFFESDLTAAVTLVDKVLEITEGEPNPENKKVLSATDAVDYWDQHGFGIMPYGPEEGQHSLYLRSEAGVIQSRLRASAIDISEFNFNNTVLTFWFYINDVTLMSDKDAQIELGSGLLEDDKNEFGWDFKTSSIDGLESGKWHKIALRIMPKGMENSNETGMVDLSQIRFFRMYWLDEEKQGPTARALLSTITIEEMDVSAFGTDKLMILEKRDFTQGTTPGEIDEYDMIESADGTFPQERPGTTHPDDSTGTVDSGSTGNGSETQTASCGGCSGAGLGQAAVLALIVIPCSALLLKRRRE